MAKINQDVDFDTTPQSRVEDIIKATVDGEEYDKPAESRVEYWLIELKNAIEGGGGGSSTEYATALSLSLNTSTYVLTAQLLNKDGDPLGTAQTIDLPLESTVVNGSYNAQSQSLILTLVSGQTITIPISDLIAGLQEEITAQNKLSADLVDDTNAVNKFVTTAEKTKLGKAITTDDITVESDYFVLNGVRVYVSATMPTGNIPEGSVWIPGGAI